MVSFRSQSKRPHRTTLIVPLTAVSSSTALIVLAAAYLSISPVTTAFAFSCCQNRIPIPSSSNSNSALHMTPPETPMDDDIAKLQAKARALLEKSKAKLAQKEQALEEEETLPFFAAADSSASSNMSPEDRRSSVTKSTDESSGLIRADGDKMAQRSEAEAWERRPLTEVFDNELEKEDDVYSVASQQLADRDVAASIFNLRQQLQTEDYQKIFDKRNRFIGEDN